MKKILSSKTTAIILLAVTILMLGFYIYMIARPISYGMDYYSKTEYKGGVFEGTMKFYPDTTMYNKNTNLDEEMKSRHYYKNGYVFFMVADTDEEYNAEVAYINDNFTASTKTPFYTGKISAFSLVMEQVDGYSQVYSCHGATVFAIVGGIVEVLLFGLTSVVFILRRRTKAQIA